MKWLVIIILTNNFLLAIYNVGWNCLIFLHHNNNDNDFIWPLPNGSMWTKVDPAQFISEPDSSPFVSLVGDMHDNGGRVVREHKGWWSVLAPSIVRGATPNAWIENQLGMSQFQNSLVQSHVHVNKFIASDGMVPVLEQINFIQVSSLNTWWGAWENPSVMPN